MSLKKASGKRSKLNQLEKVVRKQFSDNIWDGVKTALGVAATLSFRNRQSCIVLILEGASGKGKSTVVNIVTPDREQNEEQIIRVDDFTPASFVSHAANRTQEELEDIDLLPKLKDKVMLTKELAPLFRDADKELRQNFARLTSVLDGFGYQTSSGTHGLRGYEGNYAFNWIGATTPIPNRSHKVMAQLGNRMLFYVIEDKQPAEKELIKYAKDNARRKTIEQSRTAANEVIELHFKKHPVNSVDADCIYVPDGQIKGIVRYATLIAHGRIEIEKDEQGDYHGGNPEGPYRIIELLQYIARGLALLDGRKRVNTDDLRLIFYIAVSSMPERRRKLLRALINNRGQLSIREVEEILEVTAPTAQSYMKELASTGIVEYKQGISRVSTAATITLRQKWRWLLTTP